MINYEFPLNERIRKFLRVEEIFKKMEAQLSNKQEFSAHTCFTTYFDIMVFAARGDLKVELIQEIEKQRLKLKSKIKTKKNVKFLADLNKIRLHLEKAKVIAGFNFGGDKFLHELKTRSDSPYGIVSTDFPEFQFWLESTSFLERRAYFKNKLQDIDSIKIAINTLMRLLRDNVKNKIMETKADEIQYKLDPLLKNDLVIITLPKKPKCFPNISSNKYAVNVHLRIQPNKSKVSAKAIKFKLGIASF
jgi:cell division protein ZapD|tara:strand:+ start:707 stop:1447 length:741 start_codon:yes stop_codon:yes gene_type:complete